MALGVNKWISIDGNFGAGGSWSLGAVPGVNDVAVFDGVASQHDVVSGLNASASACTQFLFKPQYAGRVGSQGNPLQLKTSGGIIVWRGSGQAFINPSVGGAGNVVCDVNRPIATDNLILGGMGSSKGTIYMLAVKAGNCRCEGDLGFFDTIYVVGDRARLTIDANTGDGATDPLTIIASAGRLENWRVLQANSILHVGNRAQVIQRGILPSTIHVIIDANGKFQYLPASVTGTTPTLSAIGGVYDMSDEIGDNVWAQSVVGPDCQVIGGVLRSSNIFPPDFDLSEEYPGAQE